MNLKSLPSIWYSHDFHEIDGRENGAQIRFQIEVRDCSFITGWGDGSENVEGLEGVYEKNLPPGDDENLQLKEKFPNLTDFEISPLRY